MLVPLVLLVSILATPVSAYAVRVPSPITLTARWSKATIAPRSESSYPVTIVNAAKAPAQGSTIQASFNPASPDLTYSYTSYVDTTGSTNPVTQGTPVTFDGVSYESNVATETTTLSGDSLPSEYVDALKGCVTFTWYLEDGTRLSSTGATLQGGVYTSKPYTLSSKTRYKRVYAVVTSSKFDGSVRSALSETITPTLYAQWSRVTLSNTNGSYPVTLSNASTNANPQNVAPVTGEELVATFKPRTSAATYTYTRYGEGLKEETISFNGSGITSEEVAALQPVFTWCLEGGTVIGTTTEYALDENNNLISAPFVVPAAAGGNKVYVKVTDGASKLYGSATSNLTKKIEANLASALAQSEEGGITIANMAGTSPVTLVNTSAQDSDPAVVAPTAGNKLKATFDIASANLVYSYNDINGNPVSFDGSMATAADAASLRFTFEWYNEAGEKITSRSNVSAVKGTTSYVSDYIIPANTKVHYHQLYVLVRETRTGKIVGEATSDKIVGEATSDKTAKVLRSPEFSAMWSTLSLSNAPGSYPVSVVNTSDANSDPTVKAPKPGNLIQARFDPTSADTRYSYTRYTDGLMSEKVTLTGADITQDEATRLTPTFILCAEDGTVITKSTSFTRDGTVYTSAPLELTSDLAYEKVYIKVQDRSKLSGFATSNMMPVAVDTSLTAVWSPTYMANKGSTYPIVVTNVSDNDKDVSTNAPKTGDKVAATIDLTSSNIQYSYRRYTDDPAITETVLYDGSDVTQHDLKAIPNLKVIWYLTTGTSLGTSYAYPEKDPNDNSVYTGRYITPTYVLPVRAAGRSVYAKVTRTKSPLYGTITSPSFNVASKINLGAKWDYIRMIDAPNMHAVSVVNTTNAGNVPTSSIPATGDVLQASFTPSNTAKVAFYYDAYTNDLMSKQRIPVSWATDITEDEKSKLQPRFYWLASDGTQLASTIGTNTNGTYTATLTLSSSYISKLAGQPVHVIVKNNATSYYPGVLTSEGTEVKAITIKHYLQNLDPTSITSAGTTYTLAESETVEMVIKETINLDDFKHTFEGFSYAAAYRGDGGEGRSVANTLASTSTVAASDTVLSYYYTRVANNYNLGSAPTGIAELTGTPATSGVRYGATITLGATMQPGYHFAGWTATDANGDSSAEIGDEPNAQASFSMPAASVKMTPHAEPNVYGLTFDTNGATSSGTTEAWYEYGTAEYYTDANLSAPVNLNGTSIIVPKRIGYFFDGYWSEESSNNGKGKQYIDSSGNFLLTAVDMSGAELQGERAATIIPSGFITTTRLYAKWIRAVNVTVKHYGQDITANDTGEATTYSVIRTQVFSYQKPGDTFAVRGCDRSFEGFMLATSDAYRIGDGGTNRTGGVVATQAELSNGITVGDVDITISIYYIRNAFNFTLASASNVTTEGSTASGTYQYGYEIKLSAIPGSDYVFSGWKSSNTSLVSDLDDADSSFTMPAGSITMTPTVVRKYAPITVYHYLQNLNANSNTPLSTYTLQERTIITQQEALKDFAIAGAVQGYTGYSVSKEDPYRSGDGGTNRAGGAVATSIEVQPDDTNKVSIYYDRTKSFFTLGSAAGVTTTGSSENGALFYYGATVTLKASVQAGYSWSLWKSSDSSAVSDRTASNTTFAMPDSNITMTPVVTPNLYGFTFDDNNGVANNARAWYRYGTKAFYEENTLETRITLDGNYDRVAIPSKAGSVFLGYYSGETNGNGSGTQLVDANGDFTMEAARVAASSSGGTTALHARWVDEYATVTVRHYVQKLKSATSNAVLSNVYSLKEVETLTEEEIGASFSIPAHANDYAGFTYETCRAINGGTRKTGSYVTSLVVPEGGATVSIYYTRNKYSFSLSGVPSYITTSGTSASTSYYYGSTIKLNATARAGYTFTGWRSNTSLVESIEEPSSSFTMPAGAVTMTPQAKANIYGLELNNVIEATTVGTTMAWYSYGTKTFYTTNALKTKINTNGTKITVPKKNRYTFQGYYSDLVDGNGDGTQYIDASGNFQAAASQIVAEEPGETTEIYAKWTATGTTIRYRGNGKTGGIVPYLDVKTDNVDYIVKANTLTKDPTSIAGADYVVTFDPNGGSVTPTSLTAHNMQKWKANGWNLNSTTGDLYPSNSTYSQNASATFYAHWDPDGEVRGSVELPTPTKAGSTFDGWRVGSQTGTNVGSSGTYTPTKNVTLVAAWQPNTYSFVLDDADATTAGTTEVWYKSGVRKFYSNEACTSTLSSNKVSIPVKTGFSFAGYYLDVTDGNGSGTQLIDENGNILSGAEDIIPEEPNTTTELYAKWEYADYKITLNSGGASSTSHTKTLWERYGAGVYLSNTAGTAPDLTKALTSTTTQSSFTNPTRSYTVTFNANGGQLTRSSTATATSSFKGYYTSSSGGTQMITVDRKLTSAFTDTTFNANTTLYAQWTSASVRLPTSTECTYGDADLLGWYTDDTLNTRAGIPGGTYTPTQNITLYAKWDGVDTGPESFPITYNSNGGTGTLPSAGNKNAGEAYTLGTNSLSWSSESVKSYTVAYNAGSGTVSVNTSNTTATVTRSYTADAWRLNSANGTRYANGASYQEDAAAVFYAGKKSQDSTSSVTLPTPTPPSGYVFDGWYTGSNGTGSKIGVGGGSYTPSSNITLYAKWSVKSYTFTLGSATGVSTSGSTSTGSYNFGTTITLKASTSAGYIWGGWRSSNTSLMANKSDANTSFSMPAGNITMTPSATPITYTIAFTNTNANVSGYTTAPSNMNATYDVTYNLPGSGASGAPSCSLQRAFTVTYNYNYSSGVPSGGVASQTQPANSSATARATLAGWKLNNSGSATWTAKNVTTTNGATVTYYPSWNEGSVTLPTPSRSGYTFAGWYTTSTGSTKAGSGGGSYTPTTNVTLYAHWTANTNTAFKVYRYVQNIASSSYTLYKGDSSSFQNRSGTSDSVLNVSSYSTNIEGFTFDGAYIESTVGNNQTSNPSNSSAKVTTFTVTPEGTRILYLYYTRNKYTLTVPSATLSVPGSTISAVRSNGRTVQVHSKTVSVNANNQVLNIEYEQDIYIGFKLKPGYYVASTSDWSWTQASGSAVTVSPHVVGDSIGKTDAQTTDASLTATMPAGNVTVGLTIRLVNYTLTWNLNPSYTWVHNPSSMGTSFVSSSASSGIKTDAHPSTRTWTTTYTVETDAFKVSPAPTLVGHSLSGWTRNKTANTTWATGSTFAGQSATSTTVTALTVTKGSYGNETFTAVWSGLQYQITLKTGISGFRDDADFAHNSTNANKTDTSSTASGPGSGATLTYRVTDTINLGTPRKTGYTFGGWEWTLTQNNGSGDVTNAYDKTRTYGDVTATASFTANKYTVTYHARNNSTTTTTSTHTFNQAQALTSNSFAAPTREGTATVGNGYAFIGWATSDARAAAGTVDFEGGERVVFSSVGGNATQEGTIYLYGSDLLAPTTAADKAKAGRVGATIYSSTRTVNGVTVHGNVDLYAVWKRTVTFRSGISDVTSGTARAMSDTATQYYGSTVTVPNTLNPTSGTKGVNTNLGNGWTHINWSTSNANGNNTISSPLYNTTGAISPNNNELWAVYQRSVEVVYEGGNKTVTPDRVPSAAIGSKASEVPFTTQYYNSGGASTAVTTYTYALSANPYPTTYYIRGWHFTQWSLSQWSASTGSSATVTNENAGANYILRPAANRSRTVTATALWGQNRYSIVFSDADKPNDATTQATAKTWPSNIAYTNTTPPTYDAVRALPYDTASIPTRRGYDFVGWTTHDAVVYNNSYALATRSYVTADYATMAARRKRSYTLSYSNLSILATDHLAEGYDTSASPAVAATDKSSGTSVKQGQQTPTITLTAQWQPKVGYTVVYNTNAYDPETGVNVNVDSNSANNVTNMPSASDRNGTSSGATGITWTTMGLTKVPGNGGSLNPQGDLYAPKRTGYTFEGWSWDPNWNADTNTNRANYIVDENWTYGQVAKKQYDSSQYDTLSYEPGQVTLYAIWKPVRPTVTFDSTGVSGTPAASDTKIESISISYNATTLANTTGGVSGGDDARAIATNPSKTLSTVSNSSDWTQSRITSKTTTAASATLCYDITYTITAKVTRPYFTFMGWSTTKQNAGSDTWNTMPNRSGLYAKDNTSDGPYASYAYDNEFKNIVVNNNTVTISTKRLNDLANGSTRFDAGNNVTLYAVWQQHSYNVVYKDMNGQMGVSEQDVKAGESYQVLTPFAARLVAPEGWKFSHYTMAVSDGITADNRTNAGSKNASITNLNRVLPGAYANGLVDTLSTHSLVTLTAQWEREEVTVHFDANGNEVNPATVDPAQRVYMVSSSAKLGTLPTPIRNGYTFEGWYTQPTGGTRITNNTTVPTVDTTYYAHWSATTYTFTLDPANGDEFRTADAATTHNYSIESTGFVVRPPYTEMSDAESTGIVVEPPYWHGHEFVGWVDTGLGVDATTQALSIPTGSVGNRHYTAAWRPRSYTVSFNANDGSASPATSTQILAYGETHKLRAASFTREGYTFVGWAWDASAFAPTFEDQATIDDHDIVTHDEGDRVTLYAVWKPADLGRSDGHAYAVFATAPGSFADGHSYEAGTLLFIRSLSTGVATGTLTAPSNITDIEGTTHTGVVYSGVESARWNATATNAETNETAVPWRTTGGVTIDKIVSVYAPKSQSVAPLTMAHWFDGATQLTAATLDGLDASRAESLASLFEACTSLTTLDASGLTGGVASDFSRAFANCTALTLLDISGLDTRAATNMGDLFVGVDALLAVRLGPTFNFKGVNTPEQEIATYPERQALLPIATSPSTTFITSWLIPGSDVATITNGELREAGAVATPGWYRRSTDVDLTALSNDDAQLPDTYAVRLEAGEGVKGGACLLGEGRHKAGEVVYVKATLQPGYANLTWTESTSGVAAGSRIAAFGKDTNVALPGFWSFTMPARDITLTASATPGSYALTLAAGGVSEGVGNSGTASVYETYGKGVFTTAGGNTAVSSANFTKPTAVWTVTYDAQGGTLANGGGVADGKQSVARTFNGYYSAPTNSLSSLVSISANRLINADGSINAASWSSVNYGAYTRYVAPDTLYASNGNAARTLQADTLYASWTNNAITLPTPTRTGYSFAGWSTVPAHTDATNANGGLKGSFTPSSNVTLYATWTPIDYVVTYKHKASTVNGGSYTDVADSLAATQITNSNRKTFTIGESFALTSPSWDGYVFRGWVGTNASGTFLGSTSAPAEKGTVPSTATTGNITLTGYWVSIASSNYRVTIRIPNAGTLIGGNFSGWTQTATNPYYLYSRTINATDKTSVTLPAALCLGRHIASWRNDNTGESSETVTIRPDSLIGDRSYTATWATNTYNVRFNGNGGTVGGVPDGATTTVQEKLVWDVSTPLVSNPFGRSYNVTFDYAGGTSVGNSGTIVRSQTKTAVYTFRGWGTTAAAAGAGTVAHTNGASVSKLTDVDGATVDRYALWNTASVTAPAAPTRIGYTFQGWYTEAVGGSKVADASGSYTPTVDTTLYAHWAPVLSTVSFVPNQYVSHDPFGRPYNSTTTASTLSATSMQSYVGYPLGNRNNNLITSWNVAGATSDLGVATEMRNDQLTPGGRATRLQRLRASDTNAGWSHTVAGVSNGGTYTFTVPAFGIGTWTAGQAGTGTRIVTPENNVNYVPFTTTYNADGNNKPVIINNTHAGAELTYGIPVLQSGSLAALPTATRTGYQFVWWNTKADNTGVDMVADPALRSNGAAASMITPTGSEAIYAGTTTPTYYAQWAPNSYRVLFDANMEAYNGREFTPPVGQMAAQAMVYDHAATLNVNELDSVDVYETAVLHGSDLALAAGKSGFYKRGYDFIGWNTSPTGTAGSATTPYAASTTPAITGTATAVTAYDRGMGSKVNATGTGYNANTAGYRYANGEQVVNLTATQYGTVTLYAQWEMTPAAGDAYALYTADGELIFFRSERHYDRLDTDGDHRVGVQTVTDITVENLRCTRNLNATEADRRAHTYTGELYVNIENINATRAEEVPWIYDHAGQIRSVRVADFDQDVLRGTTRRQLIAPVSTAYWFAGCSGIVTEVYTPTSEPVTKIRPSRASEEGGELAEMCDLRGFNTTITRSMSHMFAGCSGLVKLSVDIFNADRSSTAAVTDMSSMFDGCKLIEELAVGTFRTNSVTRMDRMFAGCESIDGIVLGSYEDLAFNGGTVRNWTYAWDTSNLTSMSGMFRNCDMLTEIDLARLDTSKVSTMSDLLRGCRSLKRAEFTLRGADASATTANDAKVARWSTKNALNLSGMFADCSKLVALDLSRFTTTSATNMGRMFAGCESLERVTLGDDFRFTGASSASEVASKAASAGWSLEGETTWALLPDPPRDGLHSGLWMGSNAAGTRGYEPRTAEALCTAYTRGMAGTYVWAYGLSSTGGSGENPVVMWVACGAVLVAVAILVWRSRHRM